MELQLKVATGSFTVDGPSVGAVTVRKINLNKGTFRLRLKNVASASKVKSVKVKVRNLEGKKKTKTYTAKKKGSYYDLSVAMKDYGYALGKYRFTVQVTDGNGITKDVKVVTYTFEKERSCHYSKAEIQRNQTAADSRESGNRSSR